MSEIKCIYPITNTWRGSNYIEDSRNAKEKISIKIERNQLQLERCNQRIRKTNWTQEDVMIKAIKCSNESRWNSPRYMHNE